MSATAVDKATASGGAAMRCEDISGTKTRREIANSNERRRMQNINVGFNQLRDLILSPDERADIERNGKLSKATILQESAALIIKLKHDQQKLERDLKELKCRMAQYEGCAPMVPAHAFMPRPSVPAQFVQTANNGPLSPPVLNGVYPPQPYNSPSTSGPNSFMSVLIRPTTTVPSPAQEPSPGIRVPGVPLGHTVPTQFVPPPSPPLSTQQTLTSSTKAGLFICRKPIIPESPKTDVVVDAPGSEPRAQCPKRPRSHSDVGLQKRFLASSEKADSDQKKQNLDVIVEAMRFVL